MVANLTNLGATNLHAVSTSYLTGANVAGTPGQRFYNSISCDQVLAQHLGQGTRYASLTLSAKERDGGFNSGHGERLSLAWDESGKPIPGINRPIDLYHKLLKAIVLGVSGYLLKSATVRQIIDGIRSVMDGGASLEPDIAKFIIKTLKTKLPGSEIDILLTEREMEFLSLLAEGLVMKEIAEKPGICTSTVVTCIGRLYSKLEVKNAPSAVVKAFAVGILPLDEDSQDR